MGTVQISFSDLVVTGGRSNGLNITGWYNYDTGLSTDDALAIENFLSYITQGSSGIASGNIAYSNSPTSPMFELDGNPGIDFASLPAGFTIDTLKLNLTASVAAGAYPASTISINIGDISITSPTAAGPDQGNISVTNQNIFTGSFTLTDVMDLITTITLSVDTSDVMGPAYYSFCFFYGGTITGIYHNQAYTFKLNVPQPVTPGDTVSLTSNGTSNPIDFTKVTSLTVGGIDVDSSLWTFSEFFFSFPTPDYSILGILEIVITSTEFSGSMSLGKITTILFKGASGIYTLDPTATHDTLYDIVNGGTIDVKIPDPFIKTFFAGS